MHVFHETHRYCCTDMNVCNLTVIDLTGPLFVGLCLAYIYFYTETEWVLMPVEMFLLMNHLNIFPEDQAKI